MENEIGALPAVSPVAHVRPRASLVSQKSLSGLEFAQQFDKLKGYFAA